ncbi:major facilitator superfamily domain-containing protein [Protomyces lactucae-debilis]|uniref:Major facilitator superfamily domain-containing protein n=1 Tax=Protomyces lactucae-debilis TaxID=2754530 RepID=A0A1Y2FGI4_PROLT|nr:major facilitator superfamily domain-containing protein [Protomyces lactucae-debilis]ORY83029.1 major facilitator superfamily domain-containing protein [Protomyces lactucae-debilis]
MTPHEADVESASTVHDVLCIERQGQEQLPVQIPDGGFDAWMVVVSGFITTMNVFGFVNSFGVFQTRYVSRGGLLSKYSPSAVSVIGSVETFFVFFPALVIGRLADAGYIRSLVFGGTCMMVFGILMTSIDKTGQYYEFFLAQGVCIGLGLCPIFIPPVTLCAHWFRRKHALALGITAAGASVGGCLYPILLNLLFPKIGFSWSMRVVALIIAVTQIIPLIFLKSRMPFRKLKGQTFFDVQVFRNPAYVLVHIGLFLAFWGLYTPFYDLEIFAISNNVPVTLAFYMLPITSAASACGRVLLAFVADRYGCVNSIIPSVAAAASLLFIWLACTTQSTVIAFCVLYGCASGAVVSLSVSVVTSLSNDPAKNGIRTGQMLTLCSIATLTGPPIANAIIESVSQLLPGDGTKVFDGGAIFSGSVVMAGLACLVVARFMYDRRLCVKV